MPSSPQQVQPVTLTVALARQRHPAVGRNTLYAGIRSGRLAAVRVGKRLAISLSALDAWVEAGCPTEDGMPDRGAPRDLLEVGRA